TCYPCPVLFFFSSRRRHTRFSRDWSSDVCSSDLAAERRQQVASQRPLDRVDAAGLLPVGPRVSFDEARRELGQRGYLLFLLDLDLGAGRRRREHGIGAVREQVSLTPLTPLQRARLGLHRGPAALPVLLPVVESDHDVDFPAALAVRPDFHGHWPSLLGRRAT